MTWHYVTTDRAGWTTEYSQNQTDNAQEIWYKLSSWTDNARAAVLGNLQTESYINPGQWEIGYHYSMERGMGLGQWTPATKVSDYVGSTDRDTMANGDLQMDLLLSTPSQYKLTYLNPDGSSHYYHETGLPYITNMYDFSQSNESIPNLTKLWAICWERPGSVYYTNSINSRINHAIHWYNEFSGLPPVPPVPPTPIPYPDELLILLLKRTFGNFLNPKI